MKVVIIEDEHWAAKRLEQLLDELSIEVEVMAVLDSLTAARAWFHKNLPELAFCDIQLGDGLSFEILEEGLVKCPVVFTTAFDEYAIRAFKVNSVDYLLKPVKAEELAKALHKFREQQQPISQLLVRQLRESMANPHKQRFLVKVGEHLRSIHVEEVALFYALSKSNYLYTKSRQSIDLDYSLDELEKKLDPQKFFRISRGAIISIDNIGDMIPYSSSRIKLIPKIPFPEELILSRDRVKSFKDWLEK